MPIKPRGMHERTYQRILGMLGTTRPCESGGRVTLETTDQISIVPISGGNAEIDLLTLVVGQFVDKARGLAERRVPNTFLESFHEPGPPAHVFWWARKHAIHSMSRGSASWLSRWQKLMYFFSSTAMFVQFPPIDFFMSLNRTSEKAR